MTLRASEPGIAQNVGYEVDIASDLVERHTLQSGLGGAIGFGRANYG